MRRIQDSIKGKANEIDLDPALKKVIDFRQWFEKRLDDAIQAAEKENEKSVKSIEQADAAKVEIKQASIEDTKTETVEEKQVQKPLEKQFDDNVGGASKKIFQNTEVFGLFK